MNSTTAHSGSYNDIINQFYNDTLPKIVSGFPSYSPETLHDIEKNLKLIKKITKSLHPDLLPPPLFIANYASDFLKCVLLFTDLKEKPDERTLRRIRKHLPISSSDLRLTRQFLDISNADLGPTNFIRIRDIFLHVLNMLYRE